MTDIVERAKKLGVHDCNLHQMFDVIEALQKAFQKMRNVAAGYSNHCEDNGSTRRLEREFTEAEEMFRLIGK